jgi:eukaryotic-like serine/threonine-protein kinase
VYFYLKRYDEATETLQKSLDLQPTSRAYSNLGTIQYNQTRYADAARNFERAIKLNERDYELWRNLAETYRWIPDEKEKAKDAYTKAADLGEERRRVNPRDGTILKNLAEIYARIGNRSAALPLLEQAIKSSPTDVNVMMSAASIYDSLHDRAKALEWVGKALRNGYPIEKIDSDPQLADLRADPRFQTMRQY